MVKEVEEDFKKLIEETVRGSARDLKVGAAELAAYAAERAAHLTTLVGLKGFEAAVIAERDAVALRAGIETHRQAAEVDQRLLGVIHAGLLFGAKALVGS